MIYPRCIDKQLLMTPRVEGLPIDQIMSGDNVRILIDVAPDIVERVWVEAIFIDDSHVAGTVEAPYLLYEHIHHIGNGDIVTLNKHFITYVMPKGADITEHIKFALKEERSE